MSTRKATKLETLPPAHRETAQNNPGGHATRDDRPRTGSIRSSPEERKQEQRHKESSVSRADEFVPGTKSRRSLERKGPRGRSRRSAANDPSPIRRLYGTRAGGGGISLDQVTRLVRRHDAAATHASQSNKSPGAQHKQAACASPDRSRRNRGRLAIAVAVARPARHVAAVGKAGGEGAGRRDGRGGRPGTWPTTA